MADEKLTLEIGVTKQVVWIYKDDHVIGVLLVDEKKTETVFQSAWITNDFYDLVRGVPKE